VLSNFLIYAIGGLAMGAIYALIAVGFSMIWRAIGHLNFAQGSAVMISGFFGLTIYRWLPRNNHNVLTFLLVIVGACIGAAVLAVVAHKIVHEPILRSSAKGVAVFEVMNVMIGTLNVSIIIDNVAKLIWTGEPQNFPALIGAGLITIGDVSFPALYVWMLVLAGVLMGLLQLFFYRTKTGKSMRAVAQDRVAASLMGVNVRNSILITFVIVYVLGAIAGVMVTPIVYAYFATGMLLGLKGFAGAIIGGITSVPGAVAGSLILGVLEGIGAGIVGSGYRNALAFAILIIVLVFKPSGLFAAKKATKI
jgi:branched-chain amino acid transport system permease protein